MVHSSSEGASCPSWTYTSSDHSPARVVNVDPKVRDVQAIITLRSGKEVHQPEHDQRKAKEDKTDRKEEKKKEQKGKEVQMKESIIPSMDEEPQILLKEDMMKKHMPPNYYSKSAI